MHRFAKKINNLVAILTVSLILLTPFTTIAAPPVIKNPFDNLQISIPGMERFSNASNVDESGGFKTTWIAEYIVGIYKYAIGIIGIIAMMAIAIGGAMWVISAGNPGRISEAKSWITSGILGLALGLGSYLILGMINYDLVRFKPINMKIVKDPGLPGKDDYAEMNNNTGPFIEYKAPSDIVTIDVSTRGQVLGDKVSENTKYFTQDTTSSTTSTAPTSTLPEIKKVQVHRSIAENIKRVMIELQSIGYDVKNIGGYRPNSKFCHGKGLAVDINVPENYCIDCYGEKGKKIGLFYKPYGVPSEGAWDTHSLTFQAVEIFKKAGWCWGGDWKEFKDYMHFSINCSEAECNEAGKFDWNLSVKENHKKYNISMY